MHLLSCFTVNLQPHVEVASFDYISSEESTKIIRTFNNTDAPYPSNKSMTQLLDESIRSHSRATALIRESDGHTWTYEYLNRCSNAIAKSLLR